MNVWQFMSDSPILAFLLVWLLVHGAIGVASALRGTADNTDND